MMRAPESKTTLIRSLTGRRTRRLLAGIDSVARHTLVQADTVPERYSQTCQHLGKISFIKPQYWV